MAGFESKVFLFLCTCVVVVGTFFYFDIFVPEYFGCELDGELCECSSGEVVVSEKFVFFDSGHAIVVEELIDIIGYGCVARGEK